MGDPEIPLNNAHPAQPYRLQLCKAAITNDWPAAAAIFDEFPNNAIRETITSWGETALHLAAGSNSSHNFVANLLGRDRTALRIRTDQWNNALHYAAKAGNLKDAMVLVEEDQTMTLDYNLELQTPLHIAAVRGKRKTFEYLLIKTKIAQAAQAAQPNNWPSPFSEMMGLKLVVSVIEAEFYDLALKLLKDYPTLATQEADEKSALTTLATKQTRFGYGKIGRSLNRMIRDLKSKNPAPEKEMVIFICDTIIEEAPIHAERMIKRGIFAAIENGSYEFIKECLIRYPITLWSRNDVLELFISSIKYRQREVFDDLVRYTTPYDTLLINRWEYEGGNVLHLVAHLPRYDVQAAGAQTAMHFQIIREVSWYQAVEKMMDGPAKKALNREGKTPRMVFLEEHKGMNQKVGDWAIQVAAAGMVVAALVFTASINSLLNQSVPRIKNVTADTHSTGQTHRSENFLGLNAIAFFLSTLSMILFMSILTRRYNEGGILICMPRTLIAGVFTLYQSIICVILMAIIMMAPEKSEDATFEIGLVVLEVVLYVVFNCLVFFLIGLPYYGGLKSGGI